MLKILIIAIFLIFNNHALASDPAWFECEDIESVAGQNPQIRVGSLVDFDRKSYLLIDGWLETSSSGYKYEMQLGGVENSIQNVDLKLIAPEAGLAVIDKLQIMERFEVKGSFNGVKINIDKDFNWGPDVIKCSF